MTLQLSCIPHQMYLHCSYLVFPTKCIYIAVILYSPPNVFTLQLSCIPHQMYLHCSYLVFPTKCIDIAVILYSPPNVLTLQLSCIPHQMYLHCSYLVFPTKCIYIPLPHLIFYSPYIPHQLYGHLPSKGPFYGQKHHSTAFLCHAIFLFLAGK